MSENYRLAARKLQSAKHATLKHLLLQFSRCPARISRHWGRWSHMESGQLVLVTLYNPREKFWGLMLSLDPAGVNVRGVDLQSLDDFTQLIKAGEDVGARVGFCPIHPAPGVEDGKS